MTRGQVDILKKALRKQFGGKVEAEAVNRKGRYRFAIVSKKFERVPPLKRQDAIWELVNATLPREAAFDVSLVIAYAPSEMAMMG